MRWMDGCNQGSLDQMDGWMARELRGPRGASGKSTYVSSMRAASNYFISFLPAAEEEEEEDINNKCFFSVLAVAIELIPVAPTNAEAMLNFFLKKKMRDMEVSEKCVCFLCLF